MEESCMSLYLRIQCDGCGCVSGLPDLVTHPAHIQRSKIKEHGWATGCYSLKDRYSSGAKDYCPRCIVAYVRARRPVLIAESPGRRLRVVR